MTFGTLRLRLLKQFPGLDPDVLDGLISDRYGEILQELVWSRLEALAVLETTAPYIAGTVAMTAASNAVILTGGAWVTGMTGRSFRVTGRSETYTFTYTSASTGTLDRVYEGDNDAAATYTIFRSIYALPADCRLLADDAFAPLERFSRAQLNESAPTRPLFGTPQIWATTMDGGTTVPLMQIELYPIPDQAIGLPFDYTAEAAMPTGGSVAFVPWMEPASALVEGVTSKILRLPQFKDLAGAQLANMAAKDALSTMRNVEAQRLPHTQLELPDYFTRHRRRRW